MISFLIWIRQSFQPRYSRKCTAVNCTRQTDLRWARLTRLRVCVRHSPSSNCSSSAIAPFFPCGPDSGVVDVQPSYRFLNLKVYIWKLELAVSILMFRCNLLLTQFCLNYIGPRNLVGCVMYEYVPTDPATS